MEKRQVVDCLAPTLAHGILCDCLEDGRIIPSRHFREELLKENLTFEDAWHVLRTGRIFDPGELDNKMREWKYRIEGVEPGGKFIAIVFCFKELDTALLITIFSVDSQRRYRQ